MDDLDFSIPGNKPAPAGKLTVARGKQVTVDGWQRPTKKP